MLLALLSQLSLRDVHKDKDIVQELRKFIKEKR
jgi:hypothetical protein